MGVIACAMVLALAPKVEANSAVAAAVVAGALAVATFADIATDDNDGD